MAKTILKSGLKLDGIAPNLLLGYIENTAPFLFKKKIDISLPKREYLAKLVFYKKNLKQLSNLNLTEYFHLCLCAHWATAGTYVPTDVDNQIREKLWKHPQIQKHIDKMVQITIDAWSWDYTPMTNRKSFTDDSQVMSTHEGTWLSVAIGAYCASITHNRLDLAQKVKDVILQEVKKEEKLLQNLFNNKEYINFIKVTPLIAHNFGDLDRVMVVWDMHEKDEFCKSIYKLGHIVSDIYDPLIVYSGKVNKIFTAAENHRHMSLRKSKALRTSNKFLVPVAPFTDQWAHILATSKELTIEQKAEIITVLVDGIERESEAIGYERACKLIIELNGGLDTFAQHLPFDLIAKLKTHGFINKSPDNESDYHKVLILKLKEFKCEITDIQIS